MRLVVDLQACQTDSRDRGIGRYAMNLVQSLALALDAGDELVLAVDMADAQRTRDVRAALRSRRIVADVVAYGYPATAHTDASPAACRLAGQLRARFFAALHPDALLICTFFETGTAYCMGLDWSLLRGMTTAAVAHDVIPLHFPKRYLPAGDFFSCWYHKQLTAFGHFDLLLANSESTRRDLVEMVNLDSAKVVTILGGLDGSLATYAADASGRRDLHELGITKPFVLTVSNGDWRKNTIGALDAFARLPERLRQTHQLVLTQVGDDDRVALHDKYASLQDQVKVLGRVDDATLVSLYRECKVFYFPSYFEGFGLPVLEAMAFNAPVLSSNAGALPEVIHDLDALFDPGRPKQAAGLLAHALENDQFRRELSDGAREHALTFTWQRVAQKALEALRKSVSARSGHVAATACKPGWSGGSDIALMADACMEAGASGEQALENGLHAIARAGRRRVLVDITEIVRLDARTGIQRVTRQFFAGLFAVAQQGGHFEVEPFCWTEQGIRYARSYAREHLDVPCEGEDVPVRVEPSDLVFMLDSSWWQPERFDALHARVHEAGGEVVWMVYDLIPIRFPETCDPGMPPAFTAWLTHAVRSADGFICISEATRHDLEEFIHSILPCNARHPWTRSVRLGSDLDSAAESSPTEKATSVRDAIGERSYFTALGTVEPRKDYPTILAAFELLWARGVDVALVIIGKQGWNVGALVERIQQHPERNYRLFWLQGAGDGDVRHLLEGSAALIQASIWEGFGLPLVEANSLGVPLIASDIAVFHEVAGEHACYFPVGDATALAEVVADFMQQGEPRQHVRVVPRTWSQASWDLAEVLLPCVARDRHATFAGAGKGDQVKVSTKGVG